MIRARSTRLVGSVRDREISSKRCRCSASVGSAITRRGATTGSPNHLVQDAEVKRNILIFRNLYPSPMEISLIICTRDRDYQLALCLEAVRRIKCDRLWELIVVD